MQQETIDRSIDRIILILLQVLLHVQLPNFTLLLSVHVLYFFLGRHDITCVG
jgi:hypothetical protein